MNDIILPASAGLMKFHRRAPVKMLCPWVQCLWTREAGMALDGWEKLYPDGGASLTITLDSHQPGITLHGNLHTQHVPISAPATLLGVRFKPAGAFHLLDLAPALFTDTCLLLHESGAPHWVGELMHVVERLYRLNTREGLNLLETWLCQRLASKAVRRSRTPELLAALGHHQFSSCRLDELGLTRRTLERRLEREVGASPGQLKAFARLDRARRALADARQPLTHIALECGYHDQAHFTHAFKFLALETPGAYRKRKLSQIYKP